MPKWQHLEWRAVGWALTWTVGCNSFKLKCCLDDDFICNSLTWQFVGQSVRENSPYDKWPEFGLCASYVRGLFGICLCTHTAIQPEMGLLSLCFPFAVFPIIRTPVSFHIWQVSPQPSCNDTCQIWKWLKLSNRYYCKIINYPVQRN